jgi:hypothetical protein
MTSLKLRYLLPIAVVLLATGAFLATRSHSEASTTVQALAEDTHFHGIAVHPTDPSRLYLATHHGLYAVAGDGSATRLSPVQDFMGFTPHPTEPSTLRERPSGRRRQSWLHRLRRRWRVLEAARRGRVYYDRWHPQPDTSRERKQAEFLEHVGAGLQASAPSTSRTPLVSFSA